MANGMKMLLADVQALENLFNSGRIEKNVRRIGVEQDITLMDPSFVPADLSSELLSEIGHTFLKATTVKSNLRLKISPQAFQSSCLRLLEEELTKKVSQIALAAKQKNANVLLTSILPTLRPDHLSQNHATPNTYFETLNSAVSLLSKDKTKIVIQGDEELQVESDIEMLEAFFCRFPMYFQVSSEEFAAYYNIAQAISAPLLALAVGSPVLFGKHLWQETSIAWLKGSDDLSPKPALTSSAPPSRVSFGDRWLEESPLEIVRADILKFPLFSLETQDEDPLMILKQGKIPSLLALQFHQQVIWHWNQPCYSIFQDQPTLWIENRVLPSGPTIVDKVAELAFFCGLLIRLPQTHRDIKKRIAFEDAKKNFFLAAQHGLKAELTWVDHQKMTAQNLILGHLLPLARTGLKQSGILPDDIDRYLGIIEERVSIGRTAAQWMLETLTRFKQTLPKENLDLALTEELFTRQQTGKPVHSWRKIESKDFAAKPSLPQMSGSMPKKDVASQSSVSQSFPSPTQVVTKPEKSLTSEPQTRNITKTENPSLPPPLASTATKSKPSSIPEKNARSTQLDSTDLSYILPKTLQKQRVEQIMSTHPFTLRANDRIDLASVLVDWKHIRNVPVLNDQEEIIGLISYRTLLKGLIRSHQKNESLFAHQMMGPKPQTITPQTPIWKATELMQQNDLSCLLVIEKGKLKGIVTAYDVLGVAAQAIKIATPS